jgi:hypothetical protein
MITRPVRERPADQVRTMVADGLRRTGYDEVALTSLSTADFSGIDEVVDDISGRNELCGPGGLVSVNLPSLRVDAFTVGIAAKLQRARRSGLTFAPEAGTWRLRQVINKLITAEDLYASAESAYANGWRRMKLYFLTGLPTETDEDTLGIAELARNVVALGKQHTKGASVTVSVGGFVLGLVAGVVLERLAVDLDRAVVAARRAACRAGTVEEPRPEHRHPEDRGPGEHPPGLVLRGRHLRTSVSRRPHGRRRCDIDHVT